ncbi:MAG: YdjY domain-containing protein [Planctomycetota bacterium]|jgi:hypothetical protein
MSERRSILHPRWLAEAPGYALVLGLLASGCAGPRATDAPVDDVSVGAATETGPASAKAPEPDGPVPDEREPDEAVAAAPRSVPETPEPIVLAPGLRATPGGYRVEVDAVVCLEEGWLEQIVCAPGTREHEAIMVSDVAPSRIHAALLVAGFESGAPGRWHATDDGYGLSAPTGSEVSVAVRYEVDGETRVDPVRSWVRDHNTGRSLPDVPWVFGGSIFVEAPPGSETQEVYAADFSGSIIGLVTFGDELIGLATVIADATDVEPETWEVASEQVPGVGTPVCIVISRP